MTLSLTDPVIVSAVRTPIGKIGGSLAFVRPDDLLAHVFKHAAQQSHIDVHAVDEIFAGCANQAGEDNRNVARMASLLADFPTSIPAATVNRLCASGLEALVQAARAIRTGDAHVVLASGVESMSRSPFVMAKPERAFMTGAPQVFDSSLGWRFANPLLAKKFLLESMGETAENVAEQKKISRRDQDEFALASHERALLAQQYKMFENEIVPIEIPSKKGPLIVKDDEGPRMDCTLGALANLKAAFRPNGTVTAGNSSSLNDGAAALMMCSYEFAQAHGLQPRARIVASAVSGIHPSIMGLGPVPATQKLMDKMKCTVEDFDLIELNEAFAAQSLGVMRELGLLHERVNVHGGAIALGHPLGCSGARIVVTLLNALEKHNKSLGLATLCVGVGQGLSMAIERV